MDSRIPAKLAFNVDAAAIVIALTSVPTAHASTVTVPPRRAIRGC